MAAVSAAIWFITATRIAFSANSNEEAMLRCVKLSGHLAHLFYAGLGLGGHRHLLRGRDETVIPDWPARWLFH
jgi:hypothetical protein